MTAEQNKAVVRRFYEALVANDLATLKEVLAPDFVAHSYGAPGPQSGESKCQPGPGRSKLSTALKYLPSVLNL